VVVSDNSSNPYTVTKSPAMWYVAVDTGSGAGIESAVADSPAEPNVYSTGLIEGFGFAILTRGEKKIRTRNETE
jgi:hypothetical protein